MRLVYTICMAMYGSGVRIGMRIIKREQSPIRKGQQLENAVCCGADLSTSMYGILALPSGSTSRRPVGTSSMGSVWRGQHNYLPIVLDRCGQVGGLVDLLPQGGVWSAKKHIGITLARQKITN